MVIFFTSGTTGRPKGAMLSHRAERLRGYDVVARGPHLSMFPQFHMAAWVSYLETWIRGDVVVWIDRPEPDQLLEAIERHRIQSTYLIPAVWRRLLEADRRGADLSSLLVADTGTSATSPELLASIKAEFPGVSTSVIYGSTEAHRVAILRDEDLARKPNSVGPPNIGTAVRRDDSGELMVRNAMMFSGYLDNPGATEAAFAEGWYRTGEIAEQDSDGYLYIVGRSSELIRSGGESVSPAEVEQALRRCRGVADVAVAGVPDENWGEIVTAFVVVADGMDVSLESLRDESSATLARHKVPRRLVLINEIPRTAATGQVATTRLLELARNHQPVQRVAEASGSR